MAVQAPASSMVEQIEIVLKKGEYVRCLLDVLVFSKDIKKMRAARLA